MRRPLKSDVTAVEPTAIESARAEAASASGGIVGALDGIVTVGEAL